jgi:PAS domain-containing protein
LRSHRADSRRQKPFHPGPHPLRPISEQNLSEWRKGGYRDWLARQDTLAQVRELVADAGELAHTTDGALADHLATVVESRYAAALADWQGEPTGEFRRKLRALRGLCQDIVELRRSDHSAARLKIEQERLGRERDQTEEELIEHFKRWVRYSKVRDWICCDSLSPEERERRLREIFGLSPADTANPAAESHAATNPDDPQSN